MLAPGDFQLFYFPNVLSRDSRANVIATSSTSASFHISRPPHRNCWRGRILPQQNLSFFLYMSIQNSCKFHQCMRKRQRKAESRHTHSFHTLAKLGLVFSYKTECVWQSEITESTTYYAGSVSKYVSSSFSIGLKFKCRTPFCLPYLLFLKYQWHLKSCIHLTTVYRMSDNCNPLFHMRPIYALSVDSDQQSVER